jgi:hypothetical protein
MSAFVVDFETLDRFINGLRERAAMKGESPIFALGVRGYSLDNAHDRTELGRAILRVNIDAVEQRYPDAKGTTHMPGVFSGMTAAQYVEEYTFRIAPGTNLVWAYKAGQCILYQCSEGDVFKSVSYDRIVTMLDYVSNGGDITENHPEYDAAPWG